MIFQATLIVGIVVGTICLFGAVHNYVRHRHFGLGGVVLVAFGSMLLGLSIWQSVELTIDAEGNITAKYTQDIGAEAAKRNNQIEELRLRIAENTELIDQLKAALSVRSTAPSQASSQRIAREKFEQNSAYSVLVFYRSTQENIAEQVASALVGRGFKSSATMSDLRESRRQLSAGSAWVIYTSRGENILPQLKQLLPDIAPDVVYEYKDDSASLRRGDVQILMF